MPDLRFRRRMVTVPPGMAFALGVKVPRHSVEFAQGDINKRLDATLSRQVTLRKQQRPSAKEKPKGPLRTNTPAEEARNQNIENLQSRATRVSYSSHF